MLNLTDAFDMLKSKLVVVKVLFIVILLLEEITLQLTGHSCRLQNENISSLKYTRYKVVGFKMPVIFKFIICNIKPE